MTSIEGVWKRIKQAAHDSSVRRTIPNENEARATVLRFIDEECAEAVPEEALAFLSCELVALAREEQDRSYISPLDDRERRDGSYASSAQPQHGA